MPIARINNHRMHYEVHGTGKPLILSGGWGTFCRGDERRLPACITDRYSVVIFDDRGLGDPLDHDDASSRPGDPRRFLERRCDRLGLHVVQRVKAHHAFEMTVGEGHGRAV